MYVIVVMRVNSPWRFLLFVDTSIVSMPLESSRFFTFLGFLIWNNEKYKCKYKFYKDLEYLGIFWHFVFSKSLYYCLLLEFSVLCLILISLFPYVFSWIRRFNINFIFTRLFLTFHQKNVDLHSWSGLLFSWKSLLCTDNVSLR